MTNRRAFIKKSGALALTSSLPMSINFNPLSKSKLGVALVGLGYYSRDILAPALQLTKHCELKGIVTGSPDKIPTWQKKYGIKDQNVYNYENMHTIANNDDIDIVYIVLPNGLHKKYTLIGANAGKHVWCEKPMAPTVKDCEVMIDTCNKNKVQLTIGYRMQHEPVTQKIMSWAKSKPYGQINSLYAEAGFNGGFRNGNHWKLNPELGGGAMYDMGVYPLNAVRYATGLEPISVTAKSENTKPDIIKVDETMYFDLEFPQQIKAKCKTTFADFLNTLEVKCKNGGYTLSPFQSYSGVKGITSDGKTLKPFSGNQQAKQMDDDALAIINHTNPIVPGLEGLKDIKVVEAVYKSAKQNGKKVMI